MSKIQALKAKKTPGEDPSDYYWPPEFQQGRDEIRAEERREEARHRVKSP
jgi:hypothetical protein